MAAVPDGLWRDRVPFDAAPAAPVAAGLSIVGIGEDGVAGLSPPPAGDRVGARSCSAGARHLELAAMR
jgi:hypothetical protein